ncbi:hypothetical protein HZH68_001351 [Vespula germanica]|uniref:Uncharacterized protein n=1 Tax=Vespula germanica TaxID=30212 RepID=A0A834U6T7_VESGE|nr:hypothetical protein HZH68_001351 [Vespula germanica]
MHCPPCTGCGPSSVEQPPRPISGTNVLSREEKEEEEEEKKEEEEKEEEEEEETSGQLPQSFADSSNSSNSSNIIVMKSAKKIGKDRSKIKSYKSLDSIL